MCQNLAVTALYLASGAHAFAELASGVVEQEGREEHEARGGRRDEHQDAAHDL